MKIKEIQKAIKEFKTNLIGDYVYHPEIAKVYRHVWKRLQDEATFTFSEPDIEWKQDGIYVILPFKLRYETKEGKSVSVKTSVEFCM